MCARACVRVCIISLVVVFSFSCAFLSMLWHCFGFLLYMCLLLSRKSIGLHRLQVMIMSLAATYPFTLHLHSILKKKIRPVMQICLLRLKASFAFLPSFPFCNSKQTQVFLVACIRLRHYRAYPSTEGTLNLYLFVLYCWILWQTVWIVLYNLQKQLTDHHFCKDGKGQQK